MGWQSDHHTVFEWPQPGTGGHTEEKEEEGGAASFSLEDGRRRQQRVIKWGTTNDDGNDYSSHPSDKWDTSTPGVIRDGGRGGRHAAMTWRARGHGGVWHDYWAYQHNNQSVQRRRNEECPCPMPRQQPRRRHRRGLDGERRREPCTSIAGSSR